MREKRDAEEDMAFCKTDIAKSLKAEVLFAVVEIGDGIGIYWIKRAMEAEKKLKKAKAKRERIEVALEGAVLYQLGVSSFWAARAATWKAKAKEQRKGIRDACEIARESVKTLGRSPYYTPPPDCWPPAMPPDYYRVTCHGGTGKDPQ